jgi:hypothetical protein
MFLFILFCYRAVFSLLMFGNFGIISNQYVIPQGRIYSFVLPKEAGHKFNPQPGWFVLWMLETRPFAIVA